ncbi:hypothetical protein O3M35_010960 [Rhynocoris fuscipes]|uniref:F-box domain-containing protein n=1 Tax=Rhynocoris fuscipes TaxID=488301 RepID=A0AAW1D1X1_9HEMI
MDISIRNGIVLENILPYIEDATTVMRLSAVCKRWYELLNTDTILWNRLLNLEQIEDPQYWNRVDDNDEWTLGTPCTPKNILINYRKTYYYIKHNIYKKYEFECDDNNVFEYNGKTLMFTKDWVLQIYKIINNNLELFQKIDLSIYEILDSNFFHGYDFEFIKELYVFSNREFIVTIRKGYMVNSYRLIGDKYEAFNQRALDEFGLINGDITAKLLDTNILIGTFLRSTLSVIAWNIVDNRIIFNAADNEFIKYDKGIVYIRDIVRKQLVLYNEKFDIINRVDQRFDYGIVDIISSDQLSYIVYYSYEYDNIDNSLAISIYDKVSATVNIGRMSFHVDTARLFNIFTVNENIIVTFRIDNEQFIECYNVNFQQLWSRKISSADTAQLIQPYIYSCPNTFCYLFNKLLIIKYNKENNFIIEFIDVDCGHFLTSIEIFHSVDREFFSFNKDLLVFTSSRNKILHLYHDNDEWTLGTPCTPKNILINYRKTYYYIKHNIYKKYEFQCDDNNVYEYNGKTLMFTKDWIYSDFKLERWCYSEPLRLLHSNVVIGTFYNRDSVNSLIAWNIPDNRIIFNAPNNEFIKYDRNIVYIYNRDEKKLLLYNEEFELISSIDENCKLGFIDIITNANHLYIVHRDFVSSYSVTVWYRNVNKRIKTKLFHIDDRKRDFKLFPINNGDSIIIANLSQTEPLIQSYDIIFNQLIWSIILPTDINSCSKFYYFFNKLIILKENKLTNEYIIEFRNVNNGIILSTINTKLFNRDFLEFNNDMLIFSNNMNKTHITILLYC